MRIKCLHGFFIFQETRVGQISQFMSYSGLTLVPWRDFYTFEDLADAKSYSLEGQDYLGAIATENCEGNPWDIFEANGLVYNFNTGFIVPIASIAQNIQVTLAGNRFLSNGLILPGSITADGSRVKDYSAWFSRNTLRFLYSEVDYV